MALPASGQISMNDVNVELGNPGTTQVSLNDTDVRTLFNIPSGAISLSDGYGCSSFAGATDTIRGAFGPTQVNPASPLGNYCFTSGTTYAQPAAPVPVCNCDQYNGRSTGTDRVLANAEKAWMFGNNLFGPGLVPWWGPPAGCGPAKTDTRLAPVGDRSLRWCFPTKTWDQNNTTFWNGLHWPDPSIHPCMQLTPDLCQAKNTSVPGFHFTQSPTVAYLHRRNLFVCIVGYPDFVMTGSSVLIPGAGRCVECAIHCKSRIDVSGAKVNGWIWKMPFASETTSFLARSSDAPAFANNWNPLYGSGFVFDSTQKAFYSQQPAHSYKYTQPAKVIDNNVVCHIGSLCYANETQSLYAAPAASTIFCQYYPLTPWCVMPSNISLSRGNVPSCQGSFSSSTFGYQWGYASGGRNNPPNEIGYGCCTQRIAKFNFSNCTWALQPGTLCGFNSAIQSKTTYLITNVPVGAAGCKLCFSTDTVSTIPTTLSYSYSYGAGSNHGNT